MRLAIFGRMTVWGLLLSLTAAVLVAPAWAQGPANNEALDLANGLFDRELWEQALAKYKQFIQASPKSTQMPGVLLRAGECGFKLDRLDEALPYFSRLVNEFPEAEETVHGSYRLGDIYLRQGKPAEAAASYQRVLDRGPKSPLASGAAYWLGEALYRQGKTPEAVAAYEKCLTLNPDDNYAVYANYSIGVAKLRSGDAAAATTRLAALLQKYPKHELVPELIFLLGEAALQTKDYAAARTRYEQVTKEHPQSRFAVLGRLGVARVLCAQGNYAEALPLFQEVAKSTEAEAAREAAMRTADCLYLLSRFAEAAVAYGAIAAQKGNPNAAAAHFWQAMALERKPDRAAARKVFEALVAAYPEHERAGEAYTHLGALQAEAGALEAAEASYKAAEAKATDPDAKVQAQYGAAWANYQRTKAEASLAAIEKLAEADPKSDTGGQIAYQVGKLRLARQDYSRAIQLLSLLVQNRPNDPNLAETLYLLGVAYEKADNAAKAGEFYKRTVDGFAPSPFAVDARSRLAILASQGGNLKDAQAQVAQLKQTNPDSPALAAAQLALAEALFGQKQYAEAAAQYGAVLAGKAEGLGPDARYGLGASYLAMKDFAKAIEAFRAGLTQYPQAPNTALVRYQLAAALMKSGDLAGAVKELEALLTAAPKGDLADEALLDLGWAYAELKQPDKAMTAFDKLLQQFAQSPFAAEAQFRIGEVRFDQGNYPLAQAAYEKLLATYKGSALEDEASYKLGWALLKQDKTADAVAPFRVAAEKAGDPAVQADARQQLGACLLKTGQFAEAAKALEPLRAKPAEGQLAATLLLLGQAYLGAEKFEAAGPAFQELLTKAPQDALAPRATLGLGRALKGQKKYDEAVTTLTKATGVADKQVAMEAQFELAETRRLQGDMRAAAMEYLKVAILYPDPEWGARSQYAAGLCYEHAQATAEAVKAYKGVLELYKNQTEWVQKAQERLRALE